MQHILSLSYGKDSLACLGAIEKLGWPLDRIVHAEVWATDTIPADLPQMVEFKAKADKIVKDRCGIEVEHVRGKWTYQDAFYRVLGGNKRPGTIYGWPIPKGPWCNSGRYQAGPPGRPRGAGGHNGAGELLPCPKCRGEVSEYGPEDWKPTWYDPDSGGDPVNYVCECGLTFCIGSYDYHETLKEWNHRPPLLTPAQMALLDRLEEEK